MKTCFTSWSPERGEFTKETTTPAKLNGYTSCGMFFEVELILFAIGGSPKNHFCDNWDIYADKKGTLYSIARQGTGCGNTYFGDCNHIRHLMRNGYFHDTLTEYGQRLMEGGKVA